MIEGVRVLRIVVLWFYGFKVLGFRVLAFLTGFWG